MRLEIGHARARHHFQARAASRKLNKLKYRANDLVRIFLLDAR